LQNEEKKVYIINKELGNNIKKPDRNGQRNIFNNIEFSGSNCNSKNNIYFINNFNLFKAQKKLIIINRYYTYYKYY